MIIDDYASFLESEAPFADRTDIGFEARIHKHRFDLNRLFLFRLVIKDHYELRVPLALDTLDFVWG